MTRDPDRNAADKTERIRVRREWVGAPKGTLTNPTCWLALLVIVALTATSAAYLAGAVHAAVAVVLNAVAIYLAFTVMHESMHGVAHENRRVNAWLGRPMGFALTISAPLFRGVHYEHHSHTNDTERDPDLFVGHAPGWLAPFWGLAVVFEYRRHYFGRKLWRNRQDLAETIARHPLDQLRQLKRQLWAALEVA